MKSNVKQRFREHEAKRYDSKAEGLKRFGLIAASVALNREFGFGEQRIRRFISALLAVYDEFDTRSTACDAYANGAKRANADTALIQLLREFRGIGIDHREIFGDGRDIGIIDDTGKRISADEFLDRLERKNG